MVLAKAGLRNLCNAKILLGIARQSGFWGVSLGDCSLAPQTTTSSTSWWPFVGLHCESLTASTSFGYIRQGQSNRMSIPAGNGATGASGTGSALEYILNLFWFNILFILISENNMNMSTYFVHTLSLFYVMKLLVIFRIKIYGKLPSFLTLCSRSS